MEVVNARLHPDRSRTMSGIDPLLKANEVTSIFQISVASLYRRMADGTLPKPIKFGGASRWSQSDILAAVEAARCAGGQQ